MEQFAGSAVKGLKPAAGIARPVACVAVSASGSTIRPWHLGLAVQATPMTTDRADFHRHRRPSVRT